MAVRALRGATTIESDDVTQITVRTKELLTEMLDRNSVDKEHLISILFTATDDIHALFPAAAARELGLGDVPLICARELDIEGATKLCIRLMVHLETDIPRAELRHIYQYGAKGLRDDLPG